MADRFFQMEKGTLKDFLCELRRLGQFAFWKRVYKQISEDDISGLSAELAYYLLLALFPFLLFVTSLTGLIIQDPGAAMNQAMGQLSRFMPREMVDVLMEFIKGPIHTDSPELLSFGAVTTIWIGSKGMNAIMKAINRAYDVVDTRRWWKLSLISIFLFILTSIGALALLVVLLGTPMAGRLGEFIGLSDFYAQAWSVLRWPVAVIVLTFSLALVYWISLNARQPLRWITPGGTLAMFASIFLSWATSIYVEHFGNYDKTYGTLGGVMILLLWLYVTSLVILIGAEVNSELAYAAERDLNEKIIEREGPKRAPAEPQLKS